MERMLPLLTIPHFTVLAPVNYVNHFTDLA